MSLACPVCRAAVPQDASVCPQCRADVSLLQSVASETQVILKRAEELRMDGQLAPAVQAYLDVLEIDPSNATARAALGPVLRALRAPRRRSTVAAGMTAGAVIAAAAFAAGWWLAK